MRKIVLIFVLLLSTVSLTSALDESWSEWSDYWKVGNVEELLSVEIDSNTTTVYERESIQFFCNVSGGCFPYIYRWNLENTISNEKNLSYNFSKVGSNTCVLTVIDSMNISASDTIIIQVNELPYDDEEDKSIVFKRTYIPDVVPENKTENLIFIPKNDILLELCMFNMYIKFPFLFIILSL